MRLIQIKNGKLRGNNNCLFFYLHYVLITIFVQIIKT